MNFSTYRFTLDLQKHHSQMSIAAFQYDTAVKLSIGITDGGVPYYLEDGCIAVLWGEKEDEEPFIHTCSIEGNTRINYEFNQFTANKIGVVKCQLRFYKEGEQVISAPKFIIVVAERVGDEEKILEDERFEDQFSALDKLFDLQSNLEVNETARNDAETARAAAEEARDTAETARAEAETARAEAEAVRVEAETARAESETSRTDAEALRAEAETARAAAESGRVEAENARVSTDAERQKLYDQVSAIDFSQIDKALADIDERYDALEALTIGQIAELENLLGGDVSV